jgi:hypothetical protein
VDFDPKLAVAAPGVETVGPLPTKVDSEGFRLQENISALGIFQPLLQPDWVPARKANINPV